MNYRNFLMGFGLMMILLGTSCASHPQRRPSNRSGRGSDEALPMNHRRLDTDSLYRACVKERPEVSCRNRLGR